MQNQAHKFGILILILVTILGLLFFKIIIYKGTLIITSPNTPLEIDTKGYRKIICSTSPCIIELAPDTYQIIASKDGHYPETRKIKIPFKKEQTTLFDLKKIPEITKLDQKPDFIKKSQDFPEPDFDFSYAYDESGNLYYLNTENKLFFRNNEAIARFPHKNAQILSGEGFVFIIKNREIYEVDIIKKQYFKLFKDTKIQDIKIDHGIGFLKTVDEFFIKKNDQPIEKLDIKPEKTAHICTFNEDIFYLEGKYIKKYPNTEIAKFKAQSPIKDLHCKNKNNIALETKDNEYYLLEF